MKLYELADTFSELFAQFDAIDGLDGDTEDFKQAWFDTLEGIEAEFDAKAENIGAYIKALTAEAAALKAEESALAKRRKSKETQIKWLKQYLLDNMQAIGRTKIDRPMAVLCVRNNPESVRIEEENAFVTLCMKAGHDEYLRYRPPEIDRTAVKRALQSGEKIEGASLVREKRIVVE